MVDKSRDDTAHPAALAKNATDDWLRSNYLGVEDGDGSSSLSVREFVNYLRYTTPDTAFFTNEMIDWAFECVRLTRNITSSSDICIVPMHISQVLYSIGIGITKDIELTSTHPDAGDYLATDAGGGLSETKTLQTVQELSPKYHNALQGKRYIFLPVNNGFASESVRKEICRAQAISCIIQRRVNQSRLNMSPKLIHNFA